MLASGDDDCTTDARSRFTGKGRGGGRGGGKGNGRGRGKGRGRGGGANRGGPREEKKEAPKLGPLALAYRGKDDKGKGEKMFIFRLHGSYKGESVKDKSGRPLSICAINGPGYDHPKFIHNTEAYRRFMAKNVKIVDGSGDTAVLTRAAVMARLRGEDKAIKRIIDEKRNVSPDEWLYLVDHSV